MRQLTNQEIAAFCEELEWLVHSGMSVGEGLRLMSEDERDTARKKLLFEMANQAAEGNALAEVVRAANCFPVYVSGNIGTGEATGRLEEALRALKVYYEGKEQMNRRMRSALLHPTFLTVLLMVVLGVLLTRVVPTFQSVYASLGGEMTGAAGVLLSIGLWLKETVWVFYGLLGIVVCLVLLYVGCRPFRERTIRLWKRFSGDRGVMRKINDAAIARVIAMGLGSGLLLEDTMELAADVMADVPQAKKRCLQCREALLSGGSLLEALKVSEVLPPSSCRLLSAGLQGGNGDSVMREIAEKLSAEADEAMSDRIDKVEPALVLAVSILVGMILLMVMLPLINIMETIG